MRREHELHVQPVEDLLHLGGGHSEFTQFGDSGRERFTERFGMPESLAVAKHPHPLPILRDVREVEEDAERPSRHRRLPVVEGFDPRDEGGFGFVSALAAVAGEAADLLHQVVGLVTGDFADHRPEHVAQEPHVAAEKFVVGHGVGCGGGRTRGGERCRWGLRAWLY